MNNARATAVALVTFATFTDVVAYAASVPVLPDLAVKLGASPTVIGVLFGSFGATMLAVSIPIGAVSDRLGRKPMLVASSMLLAAATLLFAYSNSLSWLFAARLTQGASDGVMWVAGLALVADLYGPDERGRVMGNVMSGTSFGILIGPSIGGWLYEIGGIRLPYLFVVGLALLSALGFALMPAAPSRASSAPGAPGSHLSAWSVFQVPAVARCTLLVVVAGTMITMFDPVLPLFFARSLGLSPKRIGLLFGAAACASVAMPFVVGPLTNRWGGRRLMLIGMAASAVFMPAIGLAVGIRSALVLITIEWAAMAFIATPSLAYMADVTSFAGHDAYGVGYGIFNTAWAVGLLGGPSLGGYLYGHIGFESAMVVTGVSVLALTWISSGSAPIPNR